MKGNEVMACAQTGSGKTAAFLLPIINTLLKKCNESPLPPEEQDMTGKWVSHPDCIILGPTRELVIQIAKEANAYTTKTPLRVANIYGGTALYPQKQSAMRANIIAATVGRFKTEFKIFLFYAVDKCHSCLS